MKLSIFEKVSGTNQRMMAKPDSYNEFLASLGAMEPPFNWPIALKALWHDAKGSWKDSHDIAQDMHHTIGSWIHAYLHRKEGDASNAGYWYRKANKSFPENSLEEELKEIVEYVLFD